VPASPALARKSGIALDQQGRLLDPVTGKRPIRKGPIRVTPNRERKPLARPHAKPAANTGDYWKSDKKKR
jgi:hypothetical protein